MIKLERINRIREFVFERQTVSLDELCRVFHVSKNTIRRDIKELIDSGYLKKIHGGVTVNDSALVDFTERINRNQHLKRRIAKAAANYVNDGDIIFVDTGTTTMEMVDFLKDKHITVITNNLDFITKSLSYPNLSLFSMGGMLDRKTKSFVTIKYQAQLTNFNFNKAFMASTGITITNGVTNSYPLETEIKQAVVEKCSDVYLLIDHNKFDRNGLLTYCRLDEIDHVITDEKPDQKYVEFMEANQIELIIAQ